MRRPPLPLSTLRAIWSPRDSSKRISGPIAQACEYGQLMGAEALRRQWTGGWGKPWKKICKLLGWEEHARAVA